MGGGFPLGRPLAFQEVVFLALKARETYSLWARNGSEEVILARPDPARSLKKISLYKGSSTIHLGMWGDPFPLGHPKEIHTGMWSEELVLMTQESFSSPMLPSNSTRGPVSLAINEWGTEQ